MNYFSTSHPIETNEVSLDVKCAWAGSYLFFKSVRAAVRAQLPGKRAVVEKKGRKFVIFGGFTAKLGVLMFRKRFQTLIQVRTY